MKPFFKAAALACLTCLLHTLTAAAQPRSTQELDAIANSVLSTTGGARTTNRLEMSLTSSQVLKTTHQGEGEAFYVYTPSARKESGFVIVSGDKRMPAVLGYADQGRFDADNLPDGLRWFLEKCQTDQALIASGAATTATATQTTTAIAPLLGNRAWDQGDPFNALCPLTADGKRTVTGCTATAMAQIMAHHRHPEKGTGNISYTTQTYGYPVTADLDNATAYDWENMADVYEKEYNRETGAYDILTYTDVQAAAVAQLMFHVGAALTTDYSEFASSASTNAPAKVFIDHFGYDDGISIVRRADCPDEEWCSLLQQELANARPVLVSGRDAGNTSGHAFVFDGVDANGYFHVNWGWSGLADGYYNIYHLTPTDTGYGAGSFGDYSYYCQAVVGIKPEDGVASAAPAGLLSDGIELPGGTGVFDPSAELKLNIYNLYNLNPTVSFYGELQLLLTNEETGEETAASNIFGLGSESSQLPFGSYYLPMTLKTYSFPTDLADGTYHFYIGVRQTGTEEWVKVKTSLREYTDCYGYYEVTVADGIYSIGRSNHAHTPGSDGYCACGSIMELVIDDQEEACPDFAPEHSTYATVTYNRELKTDYTYGTITLPFVPDETSLQNFCFYRINQATDDAITFEEETAPQANTPYLYSIREGATRTNSITGGLTTVSTEAESVSVNGSAWTFVGSLKNSLIDCSSAIDAHYYIFRPSTNMLHKITKTLTVYPYTAYLRRLTQSTTSDTSSVRIYINRPNGIEEISIDDVEGFGKTGMFDLQGRTLKKPAKGQIYIEDGVKKIGK